MERPHARLSARIAALALATAVLTLVEGTGIYLRRQAYGRDDSWAFAIVQDLPVWLGFALLVPAVAFVSRRWPLLPGRMVRNLPVHALAMVVFTLVHLVGVGLVYDRFFGAGPAPLWIRLRDQLYFYCGVEFLIYGAIVGVLHALALHDEGRARSIAAAQLESGLSEARLAALRAQLEPHFLFNTLNAISTLALKGDGKAVERTVGRLGDMLRASLDQSLPHEIPLARERLLLEPYLDIQRTRFGDRVSVEQDIPDECLSALVPSMILQPLVENAMRHGIEAIGGAGTVSIHARRTGDRLALEVRNTGPGFGAAAARTEGVGLSNARRRLEQLHGPLALLACGDGIEGGAWVRITVPFRTSRDGDATAGQAAGSAA